MDNQTPNQSPSATNPIENPTAAQTSPSSSRSFLSKKTMFMTLFILIILALIFATPFPRYIGEIACGAPCQDKQYCPPCPSEQWILEKPLFWSVILPMLKQSSSGRYTPISVSPTPTVDPTANWKTYTSLKGQYSIKYPTDYKEFNNQNDTGFSIVHSDTQFVMENYTLSIRVVTNSKGLTLENALGNGPLIEYGPEFLEPNKTKKIKIDRNNAVRADNLNVGQAGNLTDIIFIKDGLLYHITAGGLESEKLTQFNQILSTFKFTDLSPTPTCIPRPACLDATPRCLIPETSDMCPEAVVCTQEAKLCPDEVTYVSRKGPNCEFAPCP